MFFPLFSNLFYSVKKIIILLFISLSSLLSLTVIGQIDSLENRLIELSNSKEKVDVLNELSYIYYNNNLNKTFEYANEALALSNNLNYLKGKATAYHCLSIGNSVSSNLSLSLEQNQKVIELAKSIKANDLLIKAYNLKAVNLEKKNRPDDAIQVHLEGLKLAQKIKDNAGVGLITTNIGAIYLETEQFEKARIYFKQSIDAAEKDNDLSLIGWSTHKIARTYLKEAKWEESQFYFDKTLLIYEKLDEKRSKAFIKEGIAELYFSTNKIVLAEKTTLEAIEMLKEIGDEQSTMSLYTQLIKIYLKTNQADKAIFWSQKALEINESSKYKNYDSILGNLAAQAYAQKKEYQKAYEYNLKAQVIKDSLAIEKRTNLAMEWQEAYQSEKKEAENNLLKTQQLEQTATIRSQKLINYFLIVVAFLVSLLGYTAFVGYQNKKKNNLLLEDKVAERTAALQTTNKQLVQSNEELAKFSYVASHDLREPLRNIMNFTQLLQQKIAQKDFRDITESMAILHKNATRMNQLILDTLTFTRLSKSPLVIEKVDLNETIENIESALANTIVEKRAKIELIRPLPTINANQSTMFSLFKNLIENGIKYNEHPVPQIVIDYENKDNHLLFSVRDNGIGIPEKYQNTIFEMFKRLQNSYTNEGSGLGLAHCKKIIENMGGEIWVRSEQGKGTIFYFTLSQN